MRSRILKFWMLLPVVAVGFLSPAAQAQQTFRVYGGLAQTAYSIKFDNNAFLGYQNKTAKADYLAPTIGFTWVSPQRIYVDASYQTSLSADHDLWKDLTSQKQDFSRSSFTVTGGYVHVLSGGNTISGFGGYTQGTSTLAAPKGSLIAPTASIGWTEDRFKSQGLFVGAGGGFPALAGQFSVSGAIALMGGRWTDDTGFSADAKSTVGFSIGGGYTYRITPALGVTADLKVQNYSYTFDPLGTAPDYKVNENTTALGARVSYQF